jgi:hypothetical protein
MACHTIITGRTPDGKPIMAIACTRGERRRSCTDPVRVGLWEAVEGGWKIIGYPRAF